ncbi:MAG: T9SS type A sorting domain-containing protein [Bacteroidales bacterium]|nr:T9SS type A sorting domain-containing protein [Bacteroidales bacterium]
MKKITVLLFAMIFAIGLFAQNYEKTDPSVEVTIIEVTNTTVEASFTPNETCSSYTIMIGTASKMDMWVGMMGTPIDSLVNMWGIEVYSDSSNLWTDQIPNTEYTIYVIPKNAGGDWSPLQTHVVTTLAGGGTGLSEIEITISEVTETTARFIATQNDQTASYYDGLIQDSLYNEIGEDSAVNIIKTNGYPLYEQDDWVWSDLNSGTTYYAIAIGYNANGEWGLASIEQFTTLSITGICKTEKQKSNISIFPNPSNGTFTFTSLRKNKGQISIYNMNGQKVYEQSLTGLENAINVNELSNGLYQVVFTAENSAKIDVKQLVISK